MILDQLVLDYKSRDKISKKREGGRNKYDNSQFFIGKKCCQEVCTILCELIFKNVNF